MKLKNFLIPTTIAVVLITLFGLWQYNLFQTLSQTDMACGGDWSYTVRCPFGSYCRSLGQGPLAGGVCKPRLSSVFEIFKGQEEEKRPSPSPVERPSLPTPASRISREIAEWNSYYGEAMYTSDGSSAFSIKYPSDKYPSEWKRERWTIYPFGKNPDKGLEMRVVLGAGGRGAPAHQEIREYPAGQARFYWGKTYYETVGEYYINAYATFPKDDISYIFLLENLPASYEEEYKEIFDLMLSTFKFLD